MATECIEVEWVFLFTELEQHIHSIISQMEETFQLLVKPLISGQQVAKGREQR